MFTGSLCVPPDLERKGDGSLVELSYARSGAVSMTVSRCSYWIVCLWIVLSAAITWNLVLVFSKSSFLSKDFGVYRLRCLPGDSEM